MAKEVVTQYWDDLEDGKVEADAGTVTFALRGATYEIDLSKKNAAKLQAHLQPFIDAARKVGRGKHSQHRVNGNGSQASGYNKDQLAEIRDWAKRNGKVVKDRGRVSQDLIREWEEAHA